MEYRKQYNYLSDFNFKKIKQISLDETNLLYLDENIFSYILDDKKNSSNNGLDKLIKLKEICQSQNLIIVYSPNHLEEVSKLNQENDKLEIMKIITSLTDNHCIMPNESGYYLAKEEPKYSLRRVEKTDVSRLLEKQGVLFQKLRDIKYPEYNDKKHRDIINNSKGNVFNTISNDRFIDLIQDARSMCSKEELQISSFSSKIELIHKIKTLIHILDFLGFKVEKKNQKKVGFLYDAEHLCYASQCKYFIVDDRRLKERAEEIFNFMGFKTNVMSLNDFFNLFD